MAAHENDAVIWPTDANYWAFRRIDPARIAFSRPVYPYPLAARYKGSGDPNDAANFQPAMPPQR
jgi:feruloyl esterase